MFGGFFICLSAIMYVYQHIIRSYRNSSSNFTVQDSM
jgi:hypothetical protein